jgi:hypothetical protein
VREEIPMNSGLFRALALAVAAVALPAQAQQAGVGAGASKPGSAVEPAAVNASAQPALSVLVAPSASQLDDAGVQTIIARTGNSPLDIHVLTQYGPAYFGWPTNVAPVPFEIAVGAGSTVTVKTSDYSEASKARYAAAFDAVIPRALARANDLKTQALRPRP